MNQRQFGLAATIVALLGAGACSKPAAPSDALSQDLELAAPSKLELQPQVAHTEVVSALERTPEAKAVVKPAAQQRISRPAPQRHVVSRSVQRSAEVVAAPTSTPDLAVQPTPVEQPVEQATVTPTPAPRPVPIQQSTRRGAYRTEAEVFRDAPFPINP